MGCQFNFRRLRATNDKAAITEVAALIEDARYNDGHGRYTGSFAEAMGCEVVKRVHPESLRDAEDWLDENAEKWGQL